MFEADKLDINVKIQRIRNEIVTSGGIGTTKKLNELQIEQEKLQKLCRQEGIILGGAITAGTITIGLVASKYIKIV